MDGLLYTLYLLEFYRVSPFLLAILGLLLVWLFYELQVRAGRIQKKDLWERSGIRFFLRATPKDEQACQTCIEATCLVLLPGEVATQKFTPQEHMCTNPHGCRCVMVGLYGGWPEAGQALKDVKARGGALRLSPEAMDSLIMGAAEAQAGASADRFSIRMLQAMRDEKSNPEAALGSYRFIVDRANQDRDVSFIAPSYSRISDLLVRLGRKEEAIEEIDKFLEVYGAESSGSQSSSDGFLELMRTRRAGLA
jgi:tetratricopeptide (TPR) repeat protein